MVFHRSLSFLALALPAAFLPVHSASAQTFLSGDWTITLRGNVVASPKYPGSDELSVLPYPSIGVRRAGNRESYSAPDDPIGIPVFDAGAFRTGVSFDIIGARKTKDHPELFGLGSVKWGFEAGVFAEAWASPNFRARVDVRHGVRGHRGIVADFAADAILPYGDWTFSAGPRLTAASSKYMDAYFGVTPAEAALNGVLPAYSPGGGVRSAGVTGAASWRFAPQWRATGYVRYDRLIGPAGDSPIPRLAGSRDQFTFGAVLAYSFNVRIP